MTNATQNTSKDNAPILSPCVRLCGLDEDTGLCRGCLRTLSEITGWHKASPDEQLEILEDIESRRQALNPQPY